MINIVILPQMTNAWFCKVKEQRRYMHAHPRAHANHFIISQLLHHSGLMGNDTEKLVQHPMANLSRSAAARESTVSD